MESKNWTELVQALDMQWIWVWDRPMSPQDFVNGLEELCGRALDLKLLTLAALKEDQVGSSTAATFACCLMWGDAIGWKEHEIECDLHIGFTGSRRGPWTINHLGFTDPTRETAFSEETRASRVWQVLPAAKATALPLATALVPLRLAGVSTAVAGDRSP